MSSLTRPLISSSLGRKYVMALTGALLLVFVFGHMAGNLLLLAGPAALNHYAELLKGTPALLWTARFILLVAFLLHVYLGVQLNQENLAARPIPYFRDRAVVSSWASPHMLSSGLVVLAFLIFHLAHYTFGVVHPQYYDARDVYTMSLHAYKTWWVALTYLI